MNPLRWIKTLFLIVASHDLEAREARKAQEKTLKELGKVKAQLRALEALIVDRTSLAADISPTRHDMNVVIAIGRYRDVDYVQTFHLGSDRDLGEIIHILGQMERSGTLRRLDAPPVFKAVVSHRRGAYDRT